MHRHGGTTLGWRCAEFNRLGPTCQMIATIILAAGSSTRMGRPKAILEYRGKTFLESIVNTLRDAAVEKVLVVVEPGSQKIIKDLELRGASVIYNVDTAGDGPISSIKA